MTGLGPPSAAPATEPAPAPTSTRGAERFAPAPAPRPAAEDDVAALFTARAEAARRRG